MKGLCRSVVNTSILKQRDEIKFGSSYHDAFVHYEWDVFNMTIKSWKEIIALR